MSKGYLLQNTDNTYTGVLSLLSTTVGIDGTTTGTTNLYTVPSGKTAVVLIAIVRVTALSAFVGVGTGGIGVAAGEDDIFASQAMTGLISTAKAYSFYNDDGPFTVSSASSVIKLGIDVAFVAGSCTLAVDLLGYFL